MTEARPHTVNWSTGQRRSRVMSFALTYAKVGHLKVLTVFIFFFTKCGENDTPPDPEAVCQTPSLLRQG